MAFVFQAVRAPEDTLSAHCDQWQERGTVTAHGCQCAVSGSRGICVFKRNGRAVSQSGCMVVHLFFFVHSWKCLAVEGKTSGYRLPRGPASSPGSQQQEKGEVSAVDS